MSPRTRRFLGDGIHRSSSSRRHRWAVYVRKRAGRPNSNATCERLGATTRFYYTTISLFSIAYGSSITYRRRVSAVWHFPRTFFVTDIILLTVHTLIGLADTFNYLQFGGNLVPAAWWISTLFRHIFCRQYLFNCLAHLRSRTTRI